MSHIELDINDLTNLSDKIKDINGKISNLETKIDSKFGRARKHELYTDGFKKIKKYLEDQVTKMGEVKIKLERFQNEVISTEKAYSDRFNDIAIPTFQSTASSLTVASSPSSILGTSLIGGADGQVQENETVDSNETINSNGLIDSEETVTYKSTSKDSSNSGGFDAWGSLAAAAGVVGAGGVGTAAYIRSKAKEEDEEKKEEPKYVTIKPGEQDSHRNIYPFILDNQDVRPPMSGQPVMPQTPGGNMFPHMMEPQQVPQNNNVVGEE